MRRRPLSRTLSLVLALAAGRAEAGVRLEAQAPFEWLHPDDPGALVVTIENDDTPRDVVIVVARSPDSDAGEATDLVEIPVDLPEGARKRLVVPLAPSPYSKVTIDALERGRLVATTVAQLDVARNRPTIGVLGLVPRGLDRVARKELDLVVLELDPATLPAAERIWPKFAAIVWPAPRSTDLDQSQLQSLRAHVERGGRLVLGATHEEPDALAAAGLGSLLPARLARGEGTSIVVAEGARSGEIRDSIDPPYLETVRGFGRVVLAPRDLKDEPDESWRSLLSVDPPVKDEARTWEQPPRFVRGPVPAIDAADAQMVQPENFLPDPPWKAALVLLVAFFVAAVPVDGWLTRRAVKRGKRSRFGPLRYPALVLVAVAGAFLITEGATGRDVSAVRVDFVDVGPGDGALEGQTVVVFARGRSGRMRLSAAGAPVHVQPAQHWSSDQVHHSHRVVVSPSGGQSVERLELHALSWEPLLARCEWQPREAPAGIAPPATFGGDPTVPECAGFTHWNADHSDVRVEGGDSPVIVQPSSERAPDDSSLVRGLLHVALIHAMPDGQPADLAIVQRATTGPALLIDGAPFPDEHAYTVVRVRYPALARVPAPIESDAVVEVVP